MNNRLFCALLLLACSITLPAPAAAQVFVLSHTNIETDAAGNRTLVASCRTQMLDGTTLANYPSAESICNLNENGNLIQTVTCSARSDAFCATPTIARESVVAGANYQTTSRHVLFFQRLTNFCTVNGVFVVCDKDPLTYGLSVSAPIPPDRQITDSGLIFPAGGLTFWIGGNVNGGDDFLIGLSTETQFESAQIIPFEIHTRANEVRTFNLNGSQNIADWTLIGTAGTLAAPLRGNSVTFTAPQTVPVQQVDTLKACKVDTSHGPDCDTAQITVEVVKVNIPAGNPNDIPRPDNSTELLGGDMAQYKATVIQGATTLVDAPVTWNFSDPSGLSLITVSPGGVGSRGFGFVTVAPQSVFQNNVFVVNITATAVDQNGNPIDPAVAVSAPFNIRISPATVTMTTVPSPGLNDTSTVFRADPGRKFHFEANVVGPQNPNNRVITTWDEDFIPSLNDFSPPGQRLLDPNNPNAMDYQIISPPPKGNIISTTIKACVGGHLDSSVIGSIALKDARCAFFPMVFSAPVFPTSLPQTINSGESTLVTITGTGFGAAPVLSFSDPTVTFTPASISGPDANGVTTVTGTMTAAPVPPVLLPLIFKIVPVTITSSLPPPSIPVNQGVRVRPVTTSPAVTPVNPTLLVSQSQQFTPSLGCQTFGGFACTVPQTSTCSLFTGPGTMTTGCLYTAPASLAAQTQVQAQVCFTFGNVCTTFPINLVPVTVAVSPAAVSLRSGQSQQFQATVANVPNNNQGVTWSISPAAGSITAAGLYTAPAVVSAAQTISITACSVVNTTQCSSATVTLVPPDFGGPFLASSNFTDAQSWNQPAYYTSIRLADVNGDGKADVCARSSGGVICGLNNGTGTFSTAAQWEGIFTDAAGWNQAPYGTTMMFADINGDGKADVCGRGGAGIYCELSTGTGFGAIYLASTDFSDAQSWNSNAAYYGSLRLADVNGDGKPDICGRSSGGVICGLNNGNGTFATARQWEGSFTDAGGWNQAPYGTTMMFADINGDGKVDVCGRGAAGIYCELSTGTSFGAVYVASTDFSDAQSWNSNAAYYGSLRLADVNGDGKPDICGRSSGGVICALNNGNGTFAPARQWEGSFTDVAGWNQAPYGTTMMFGDINGDGRADVCGRGVAGIECELSRP